MAIVRLNTDKIDENFPVFFINTCVGYAQDKNADVKIEVDDAATEPVFTSDGSSVTGVVEAGKAILALAGVSSPDTESLKGTYETALSLVPKEKLPQLLEALDLTSFTTDIEKFLIYSALSSNKRLPILFKQSAAKYNAAVEFMKTHDESVAGKYVNTKLTEELANKKKAQKETAKSGSFEINLPGAKMGEVVTRFPPEPSGYLHIGHAKALLLNHYFATKYKGKMLLRFDDTNPTKEKDEFVQAIMDDCHTLGVDWVGPTYTSDYMGLMCELGEKMIKNGDAYVDNTPVDKMREERMASIEAAARSNSVEENLRLWKEMLAGSEEGLKCCVRAKIDMKHPVGCMRDPTMFRCNLTPHHRQGTKYKCYPTYDFACPVVDSIEGVTHTLRTIEYHDRNEQYNWVCDKLGLRRPHIWDYSRLNFVYTLLSKRKLQWFVDQGLVEGWFDPRFPTVQGIMRRGLTVESLREFMILQGASKNINLMEWDKLWALNKSKLEPVAPRYNAVNVENAVKLNLTDITSNEVVTTLLHPKNPATGEKDVVKSKTVLIEQEDAAQMAPEQEITLLFWGNVIIKDIERDANGIVTQINAVTNLAGDVKKTKLKIHWVGYENIDELITVDLIEFGPLITVKKPEEGQDTKDIVNHGSKEVTKAYAERAFTKAKHGDLFQFQRKGFYRVDAAPAADGTGSYSLIYIPDGKVKPLPGLKA